MNYKKPIPQDLQDKVIEQYKNAVPCKTICESLSISHRKFYRILDENNITSKLSHIDDNSILLAVNDFISGTPMSEVESKHNISNVTIYKYIKANKINYKSQHGRKHHFNQSFFSVIDTEEKAYWLGFIYADGCIYKSNSNDIRPNRIHISLSSKDRCLLEKFAKSLDTDTKIIDYIPVGTYSTSQMSRITLNTVQMCDDLAKHGCHSNKTNKLLFPYDSIEPSLYRHFIRGFFDGDGSIDATHFRIVSNKEILIEIQNILMLTCKLRRTKLKDYPHKEIEIYDLSYGGRFQLERIYNYLYQDSNFYLERKKNIFKRTISSPSA